MVKKKIDVFPLQHYTRLNEQIGELNLIENQTPDTWHDHILNPKGEADEDAIKALTEIVFWYIPIRMFNAKGQSFYTCRKFNMKMLTYNYRFLAERVGLRVVPFVSACDRLESAGLIRFETLDIKLEKKVIGQTVFVAPVPASLKLITPDLPPPSQEHCKRILSLYSETGHF